MWKWKLLLCLFSLLSNLPPAQPSDSKEATGGNQQIGYEVSKQRLLHCEGDESCYESKNCGPCSDVITLGSLVPSSLHLSISYWSASSALLTAHWSYEVGRRPIAPVDLTVAWGSEVRRHCFCASKDTDTFETLVGVPHLWSSFEVKVTVHLSNFLNAVRQLTKVVLVPDCWTAVGKNRSLEVCGVQIPSAPLNVSAELRVNSSTGVSTIAVNWSPPLHHNSPVDMYLVEAYCGAESNMSISAKSFHPPPGRAGARMQLGTADNLSLVKVRAGVRSGGGREFSLCLHESVDGTPYCFGAVGVAQVTIATSDAHTAPAAQLSTSSPVFQAPYYKGGLVAVIVMGGTAVCFMLLKFAMLL